MDEKRLAAIEALLDRDMRGPADVYPQTEPFFGLAVDLFAEVRRLRYFLETVTVVCQNCGNQGCLKLSEPFVCVCGAPLKEPVSASTTD